MSKTRPPYAVAFRQQMVELVRAGRTPGDLARAGSTIVSFRPIPPALYGTDDTLSLF